MLKLKKILVFNFLLAVSALVFAACGGSTTTTNTATNKAAENKTATNAATETKPAASPAANNTTENKAADNKSTASTGGEIGVPECDEYIKKYEACIMSKVPEAQRAMYKPTLEQMRSSWKQAASNPQTKAALASGCKTATETAKQSLSAFSCEW